MSALEVAGPGTKPTKAFALAEAIRLLEAAKREPRAADRDIYASRALKILKAVSS